MGDNAMHDLVFHYNYRHASYLSYTILANFVVHLASTIVLCLVYMLIPYPLQTVKVVILAVY